LTTVTVLRHVAFEDLGILEELFAARKWKVTYVEAPVADWDAFDALKPDLLVILGGPIGANDQDTYPFLKGELAAIGKRLQADKATLGICLGAQLIAKALGARVYPAPEKEIGWKPLLLSRVGYASPIRHLGAEHTFLFHWHGDTFELPAGAVLLAGTANSLHQAFAWGKATLAFQCHPEVRAFDMEKWLVGHAAELSTAAGVNAKVLRADTLRYGAALESHGKLCLGEWLDGLSL
jgi:GMP synthase (glutamine-hydrolysing)